jgi:hypothetical protein
MERYAMRRSRRVTFETALSLLESIYGKTGSSLRAELALFVARTERIGCLSGWPIPLPPGTT